MIFINIRHFERKPRFPGFPRFIGAILWPCVTCPRWSGRVCQQDCSLLNSREKLWRRAQVREAWTHH